jgi:L-seryl-tRNA(Ser) seleniumtransferase
MTFRNLPSVDRLLQLGETLISRFGRSLTLKALRSVLDEIRVEIVSGQEIPSNAIILSRAESCLMDWTKPKLQPVINATGVILHTNLGRAPLSRAANQAMAEISSGYSNLEFNLDTGKRGSRLVHVESVLQNLTGAEASFVVNN